MTEDFSRTAGLIGKDNLISLTEKNICIFGCGGVGSYVIEALARCAVGNITIIDNDIIDRTNINRQLIALNSTVGMDKVEVEKKRILDINPDCKVTAVKMFYDENSDFALNGFDYIIDAIDTVLSKIHLIKCAHEQNIPIISSMGTGNKLDITNFTVSDISKTSYCPLAKKIRYELKKINIYHLKVLYSPSEPIVRSVPPASISFAPAAAGLLIAHEVINDLIMKK